MHYIIYGTPVLTLLVLFVFSHPVDGAPRPFYLSVTTSDGTAGML